MPYFNKAATTTANFGKNEYLFSTEGKKINSYTVAASSVPDETIDGIVHKVLQSGEVLAKITSGPEAGKVGPFQAGVTDGRQTLANIVGINDSFEPWRLLPATGGPQDVEVGALYIGTCTQAWCFERDAAGARIALTNTTADALRGVKGLDVTFK